MRRKKNTYYTCAGFILSYDISSFPQKSYICKTDDNLLLLSYTADAVPPSFTFLPRLLEEISLVRLSL